MSLKDFVRVGRKIVAIGRNYAEHAKELGNEVPKSPMFFLKPTSSYVLQPNPVEVPKGTNVHHEVELGLVIAKDGRDIPSKEAESFVGGYFLALDMTARDIQNKARKEGNPWTVAKGFDTFTAVSDFVPKERITDPSNLRLWLKVDEKMFTPDASILTVVKSIPTLIEHVSAVMRLEKGDVILTGVGPVLPGQTMTGGLRAPNSSEDIVGFKFPVVGRPGTGLWGTGSKA
ncbi:hypothetical protein HK104_003918 [Borealophlyctis nickersoniae]|nr:hypothetical protein HK104_003918 [Borealophlyctis nickersoniae]